MKSHATLQKTLMAALDVAKLQDIELQCQTTEEVDTESETVVLTVRLPANIMGGALDLVRAIDYLREFTTLSGADLLRAPGARVVLYGAQEAHNYKIVFDLEPQQARE